MGEKKEKKNKRGGVGSKKKKRKKVNADGCTSDIILWTPVLQLIKANKKKLV